MGEIEKFGLQVFLLCIGSGSLQAVRIKNIGGHPFSKKVPVLLPTRFNILIHIKGPVSKYLRIQLLEGMNDY